VTSPGIVSAIGSGRPDFSEGLPEYAFNHQNGSDGKVRISLRSSAC